MGKRIVDFVRKPDDARAIATLIRESESKPEDTTGKKAKDHQVVLCSLGESVDGYMRGLERDELVEKEFLQKITKSNGGRPELFESRVVLKLGSRIICKNVKELIEDRGILNADPTLVFPASFGGIDKAGMLSHEAISSNNEPESSLTCSLDVADHDNYGLRVDAQTRMRILIVRAENRWKALPMPGGKPVSDDFELKNTYDTSTLLFTDLRKTGLRVRLVLPISFDEHDDCVKSLVMLAPLENKSKKEDQTLSEQVHAVESEAKRIADELKFREDDPIRI